MFTLSFGDEASLSRQKLEKKRMEKSAFIIYHR